MFKRGSRILSLVIILTIVLTSLCAGVTVNAATFAQASDLAYSWLKAQQDMTGTGLVDSFQDSQSICYTYDQAVAAIAFVLKNDQVRAKKVLDQLKLLQYANGAGNGSLYTAYYWNGTVQESNQHVGPVVWVAMAVMAYQKKYNDTYYQGMATWALDWCLNYQDMNTSSPTYGGIAGGVGQNYYSTEHNEDAYRVLKYFSTVNGKSHYSTRADLVKNFLVNKVWEPSNNRFAGAVLPGGAKDGNYPLDVNPWGVLALGTVSGTNNFRNSLNYVETSGLYVTTAGATTAYDFNPDHNDLWFEGTAFMSVAYALDGNTTKADSVITNIMSRQAANGGVPYSLYGTHNGFWQMSSSNCVSSTGWLIMAIARYNPFTCEYVSGTTTPTPTPTVTPTPVPGQIVITKLTGGSVKFSITVPQQKASVLVFAKKNGFQDYAPADIVGSGVNNGNGTYTYSITRTGAYVTGDVIVARFYTYSPASGQIFYPGPTDATWSASVTY